jgi:hypothetical protein
MINSMIGCHITLSSRNPKTFKNIGSLLSERHPFFAEFLKTLLGERIMGQNHGSMSQRSRAELLYEMVCTGNVEAVKALCREGASLEVKLIHSCSFLSTFKATDLHLVLDFCCV